MIASVRRGFSTESERPFGSDTTASVQRTLTSTGFDGSYCSTISAIRRRWESPTWRVSPRTWRSTSTSHQPLTDDELEAFAVFIAQNSRAGSVVRGSGSIRKVRWAQKGSGKSGGARVIYYNRLENGEIWLLTLYAESDRSTIPAHELKMIKEVIDRGWEKEDECRRQ